MELDVADEDGFHEIQPGRKIMIRETLSVVHRRTLVLARLSAVDYITLLIPSHSS